MQFVPTFDFGAAVQGISKGMQDWQSWEMFPIERDLKQASLDKAQLDLASTSATQQGSIAATNAKNALAAAQGSYGVDLLGASAPGSIAQARSTSSMQTELNRQLTPEMTQALVGAKLGTAANSAQAALIDSAGAVGRAPNVNALRDAQVGLGQTQTSIAQAQAQGVQNRLPTTESTLNNRALLEGGLTEVQLAALPETTRNHLARMDLEYQQIMQGGASIEAQQAFAQRRQQAMEMTDQYSKLRLSLGDPAAIAAYVARAAEQGRTITPDQAKMEIDQQSHELARAIEATTSGVSNLFNRNEVSGQDWLNAAALAGRFPGAPGQPGASNAIAGGGTGVFRTPAGQAGEAPLGLHTPNLNPGKAPEKPKPVKEWTVEQLTEARRTNPAAQKEIDRRNIEALDAFIAGKEAQINAGQMDLGAAMLGAVPISAETMGVIPMTDEQKIEANREVVAAKAERAAIKERQAIEKKAQARPNMSRDLKYPVLIGG